MNSYVISTWLLLLATTACLQNVNCENLTPLMSAVEANDVDLVKRLLANGADVKAADTYGDTALMLATVSGNVKMVEILLPKSDAKAANTDGTTALMLSTASGNVKMVEILLPKSDAKAANTYGYTALMLATGYGNDKMVEILVPKSDV